MQEIQGNAKSVRSLLSQKYHIDYYQRDYKWEPQQIQELIEDLTTRFLQDYDKSDERISVREYGQYFLGSIIISGKDNERFVVDGQQRLTSLTLLLIYLNNLQNTQADENRVEVSNLIYSTQFGVKSFNLNVPERDTCLQLLINNEIPDPSDQPTSVQNLINRHDDITLIFPDELKDEALPYFIDWLLEKVMLVEITAFSDEDAYTIFETMNDRGLSLTPTDMLKGYLLANITDQGNRVLADSVWKKQTTKLREFGKEADAGCVTAWLRSQYADTIRERRAKAKPKDFDRVGTEFHRWIRDNRQRMGLKTSASFNSLITQEFTFFASAFAFARQAATTYTPEFGSIFFNAQNRFTLQYPMMLAPLKLSDGEGIVHRKMRLVATFVEILLARRLWNFKAISYSTMQYRAFLIIKAIRGMDLEQLRDELARQLASEGPGEEYIDFNTQEDFRLHGHNGPQVHRLLARLTDFIEVGSKRHSLYPEYARRSRKKGGYQIEHIWADHPERHTEEFEHPSAFTAYRNRVGGLVLLPGPDNASYSDMKYSQKLDHYVKQNLLASSLHPIAHQNDPGFRNFITATGLPFEAKLQFEKTDLDDRQELYTALASLCWSPDRLSDI